MRAAAFGYDTHRRVVDLDVHDITDRRDYIAANAAGAYAGACAGESSSAFVDLRVSF
ncbi:hypothetical protein [Burkholderia perseverans]|uniref:hypothetical protein n=1 Tax=Burkholderia perseverans TaxID=2615214 RepID=UPI001FED759A|nr:hypothetical protein [Burkholderia perseverans]